MTKRRWRSCCGVLTLIVALAGGSCADGTPGADLATDSTVGTSSIPLVEASPSSEPVVEPVFPTSFSSSDDFDAFWGKLGLASYVVNEIHNPTALAELVDLSSVVVVGKIASVGSSIESPEEGDAQPIDIGYLYLRVEPSMVLMSPSEEGIVVKIPLGFAPDAGRAAQIADLQANVSSADHLWFLMPSMNEAGAFIPVNSASIIANRSGAVAFPVPQSSGQPLRHELENSSFDALVSSTRAAS